MSIDPKDRKNLSKEEADFLKKIGQRMRVLRLQAGYTNYESFAYKANISRTMYGYYETGRDIRITNLHKIVKAHNMTMAQFFSEGFED